MIQMISTLIEKGYAYVVSDGTVYYRTRKFADYGKLITQESGRSGGRTQKHSRSSETKRKTTLTFVLWKPKKDGEPYWESPWCDGRPGWHIECSVMAKHYSGR